MSRVVYFVELTGILKSDGTTSRTFGYCDDHEGYNVRDADTGLSADDPHYAALIKSPGSYTRSLIGKAGQLFGQADAQKGTIELENQAGSLDGLRLYAFDGRVARIMRGEVDDSGALVSGSLVTMLIARIRRVQVGWGEVIVDFIDRAGEYARVQLQPDKYLGDTGATGAEGDTSLAGRPKPHGWGLIEHLSPVLVASGYLIHQVDDRKVDSADLLISVTVGGDPITKGTQYFSFSSLTTASTAAGGWDYYLGDNTVGLGNNPNNDEGCYVKLGTLPDFTVTCRFAPGAGLNVSCSDIAYDLLESRLGYDVSSGSADVDTDALDALDTLQGASIGRAYKTEVTLAQVFDDLFGSIGAWWSIDRQDRFTCGRLDLPDTSATPDLDLTADDLLGGDDDEPVQVVDLGILGGVPVGRVQFGFEYFHTTLTGGDVDPNVSAADRLRFSEEWRLVTPANGVDQDTLDLHPLSEPFRHNTHLSDTTASSNEQARLLTMLKAETTAIRCSVQASLVSSINLGAHVKLTLDRLGMDDGLHFTLVQIEEDYGEDEATLVLWGEQAE